jgi:5-methylcytosine-specific restriction protein B
VNAKEALEALETLVEAGVARHLSGPDRRTKAILYRTPNGRSFGLELGNAVAQVQVIDPDSFRVALPGWPATYTDRATLVFEREPPGGSLPWDEVDHLHGVARLGNAEYKSSAYRLSGARLSEGHQQLVIVENADALVALVAWYDAAVPASSAAEDPIVTQDDAPAANPTNLILYGPPGTGKTYRTAEVAVQLCDGVLPDEGAAGVRRRYEALVATRQIQFVTFHQSYGYEDFVEGLRPQTGEAEDDRATAGFRLEPNPGVFRQIATLAEQARTPAAVGRQRGALELEGRRFWKMALGVKGSEEHVYQAAIAGGYVALGWGGDVDFTDRRFATIEAMRQEWTARYPDDKTRSQTDQPWTFRNAMAVGDLVIVPYGNSAFRAVAEVTGDYYFELGEGATYNQRRKVRWLLVLDEPLPLDTIVEGNFTMRTLYEIPAKRIRAEALSRLIAGPAPLPGPNPTRPDQFVLIVDEINRANVSKVFGELITLLEADKRLGQPNALTVTLPYSGDTFGVPDNLHVVGTMNTADRSIALLDTALRRRFAFRELAPRPELLSRNIEGIDLASVLAALNSRIEYLVDREHRIGHAFFMRCRSRGDIDAVMRDRVIPLLAEYFFEDWERIRLVLGEMTDAGAFLARTPLTPPPGLEDPGPDRWRYVVRESFAEDAYAQLLA